jgi:hypothetical protein
MKIGVGICFKKNLIQGKLESSVWNEVQETDSTWQQEDHHRPQTPQTKTQGRAKM